MRTTLILTSLLLLTAVVVAPTVTADHVSCIPEDPNCCDAHTPKEMLRCLDRTIDPCYTPQGYIC